MPMGCMGNLSGFGAGAVHSRLGGMKNECTVYRELGSGWFGLCQSAASGRALRVLDDGGAPADSVESKISWKCLQGQISAGGDAAHPEVPND